MEQGGLTFLTIGDVTVDEFLIIQSDNANLFCDIHHDKCRISFSYGDKIPVSDYCRGFGGGALNSAVGFARLGFKTQICGFCGDKNDSENIKKYLLSEKVGTDHLIESGPYNRSVAILFQGERTIFSYHAERNYKSLAVPNANWIYLASAAKGAEELIEKILPKISRGAKLVINPGSWEIKSFDKFLPLTKKSIVIILNKSEADIIVGEMNIKEQLKKIHELGAKIAVITDGKNGAYASASGRAMHLGIFASETVDTTGAGDSFASGFISGLIYTQSLDEAMKWGMANSASVVEKIGANAGLLTKSAIGEKVKSARDMRSSEI